MQHLEYFLLGSSLLDVLFGQKLLQAAKAITTGAERKGGKHGRPFPSATLLKRVGVIYGMCGLLQESRFVLVLYMWSKLDLRLDASKLAGLVERYGVGTV